MGATRDWQSLKSRVAGKWQIPLLAIALALFGATIYRTSPEPRTIPFKDALAGVDQALAAGVPLEAMHRARELSGEGGLTAAQRAEAELRLGRARYLVEKGIGKKPDARLAAKIARHFRAASDVLGVPPLTADDLVILAELAQWQGEFERSASFLERAIAAGHAQAEDLRQDHFELSRNHLALSNEAAIEELTSLVEDIPPHRLDLRLWAGEEMLLLAERLGRLDEAELFLDSQAPLFADSDFQYEFEFLQCRLLVARGEHVAAERRLRALRGAIERSSQVSAMAGWLLGRICAEATPARLSEALSFYSDVLHGGAKGPYMTASRIGLADALARLSRHDEALVAYHEALRDEGDGLPEHVGVGSVRASLGVTAEALRVQGDLARAIHYAELATRLADSGTNDERVLVWQQLALLEVQLADQQAREAGTEIEPAEAGEVRNRPEARLYESAARRYDQMARWKVHEESKSADLAWEAAGLFVKAGVYDEAIERYHGFMVARPEDHRGPAAMLRVGQLHYSLGALDRAAQAFEECHRRFGRSFDGARALVPLARTYLAMGDERLADAEQALRQVLGNSQLFTPQAGEFVEGLFLLGDVLDRAGRYEAAIGSLHEALDRYPSDPRVTRGRFVLGGAYRKSATGLRDRALGAVRPGQAEQWRAESVERFQAARGLYRQVIDVLERRLFELDEREEQYLEYSYLYEADCLFETQEYRDALALYERAAASLRDSARGLSAHVQAINCHVFLGEPQEAKAALARAQVQVRSMADQAFASRTGAQSREQWQDYFHWLGETGLF